MFYTLTGNIAIAIILLTLVIRALVIPLFRRQTVSQRRMQLLQPEIKEIQRRYKGDRAKISEATMALYKERGVNPAAGCLPLVLQFVLLIPMYSVIRDGLTNFDPSAMLTVFGVQVINLELPEPECTTIVNGIVKPCINTVAWRSRLEPAAGPVPAADHRRPEPAGRRSPACSSWSRAAWSCRRPAENDTGVQRPAPDDGDLPAHLDRVRRLPAGRTLPVLDRDDDLLDRAAVPDRRLGSLFPLFGWTPGFAKDHKPRFPVAMPTPITPKGATPDAPRITPTDRAASAAATVRPRERGRQGRRGRRR